MYTSDPIFFLKDKTQKPFMKFIDLFAGLGGFHVALSKLGHECVFASELDPTLQGLYQSNFGLIPHGDVRLVPTEEVPLHDILCAGFPCQSFSKAGYQEGFGCTTNGRLIDQILRIVKAREPKYLILENVPNLEKHNGGKTWSNICRRIKRLGYDIDHSKLSPHSFGIPQIRDRLYLVASRKGLGAFKWPEHGNKATRDIYDYLKRSEKNKRLIQPHVQEAISHWNEFLKSYPIGKQLPTFPIWSMEFGATYPYENITPYSVGTRRLTKHTGAFGCQLGDFKPSERLGNIPTYSQEEVDQFPTWKERFIRQNRELFESNKKWLKKWKEPVPAFTNSLQKLEWNCGNSKREIWDYLIQLRPSGIRVKLPNSIPALVTIITQVPIIGWEKRHLSPRECAGLQNLQSIKHLPKSDPVAYRAIGNAVNAKIIELIGRSLLGRSGVAKRQNYRRAS
jgi:DNA (cytosine-5)-methyltransferase 1